MATISRKEALDIICAPGAVFSIHFVTLDRSRMKTKHSRHVRYAQAQKVGAKHNLMQHRQIGIKSMDGDKPQVAVNLSLILEVNGKMVA